GFGASRMAFHPREPVLALGQAKGWFSCAVVLVDLERGKPMRRLSLPSRACWYGARRAQDGVTALSFSPDGRWLIAGTPSGSLHRWDLRGESPRPVSWPAATGRVLALLFPSAPHAL